MKKRMMKICYMMTLAAVLCGSNVTGTTGRMQVQAAENEVKNQMSTMNGTVDFQNGTASITIKGNDGQTLKGKKFQIYRLFEAENAVGMESVNYTFNPVYKASIKTAVGTRINKDASQVTEYEAIDYIQSLNTHQTEGAQSEQQKEGAYSEYRLFVEEIRNQILRDNISGEMVEVTSVRDDNSVIITGLPYGYYLVDEVSEVKGTHSAASLCMVGTANPESKMNVKSDYPVLTKKIQEDDGQDKIGNQGWNDLADFEVGQNVPYRYESNMPDVNGYKTYYYAWHDVMDEALSFQKDSVSIRIYENEDSGKYYDLKTGEFEVKESPVEGETFQVSVKDIKAIIDREFNKKNSDGENQYGQKIVLTYKATLNEKAAGHTGRPGFENDVRLEYSNDPDPTGKRNTGFTPWDTVVCFTYQINVLKTNDHGQNLADAKFRLYSDSELKNEVYVKQGENGYVVVNRDSTGGTDHTGGQQPEDAVEMKSGADGTFVIYGLDSGTYYLKETEAPAGYRLLTEAIVLDVKATFPEDRNNYVKGDGATENALKFLDASAQVREFNAGKWKESKVDLITDTGKGSANLTVVNTVGKKLPVTGSSAAVLCIAVGSGLVLAGAVRRRNEKSMKEK